MELVWLGALWVFAPETSEDAKVDLEHTMQSAAIDTQHAVKTAAVDAKHVVRKTTAAVKAKAIQRPTSTISNTARFAQ